MAYASSHYDGIQHFHLGLSAATPAAWTLPAPTRGCYTPSISSRAMTTNFCMSKLSDSDLLAAYERSTAKLSPSLDPDERVKLWQQIWIMSSELERRYSAAAEPKASAAD